MSETLERLTPCAAWADDCQGKKDYDGRLLDISCRYWPGPGGGGSMTFDTGTGQFGTLPYGKQPSAHAAVRLCFGEPDQNGFGDSTPWREAEFSGLTEADVKAQVETWVADRFDEVRSLLGMRS